MEVGAQIGGAASLSFWPRDGEASLTALAGGKDANWPLARAVSSRAFSAVSLLPAAHRPRLEGVRAVIGVGFGKLRLTGLALDARDTSANRLSQFVRRRCPT